ncbi:MAG TPA: PAS domain-containing protein [Cytophagaceae bacterium]|nr:PAS domain-containing protein [Cytophagaceae bacterium]
MTEALIQEYYGWLNKQEFVEKDLDYSALEKYKPMLKNLSLLGNNGVYVFDLYKKENVFTLYNFTGLYGYDQNESDKTSNEFLNSRIHPDDFPQLIRRAADFVEFLFPLSKEERSQYKLINEYRIKNAEGKYVRVLEQYQVLEFDKHGNIWLAMGMIDMSPEQGQQEGVQSEIFDFKSKKFLPLSDSQKKLTKENFLNAETDSALTERIKKVNTQRKKILEKLHAENATEVSKRISRYGLLE